MSGIGGMEELCFVCWGVFIYFLLSAEKYSARLSRCAEAWTRYKLRPYFVPTHNTSERFLYGSICVRLYVYVMFSKHSHRYSVENGHKLGTYERST